MRALSLGNAIAHAMLLPTVDSDEWRWAHTLCLILPIHTALCTLRPLRTHTAAYLTPIAGRHRRPPSVCMQRTRALRHRRHPSRVNVAHGDWRCSRSRGLASDGGWRSPVPQCPSIGGGCRRDRRCFRPPFCAQAKPTRVLQSNSYKSVADGLRWTYRVQRTILHQWWRLQTGYTIAQGRFC